jgi:hypothetical protein
MGDAVEERGRTRYERASAMVVLVVCIGLVLIWLWLLSYGLAYLMRS